jgi:transcriptional regulator with XRE-family HTH domain
MCTSLGDGLSCYKMALYTGTENTRLNELGAFLRSRRSRLKPQDLGLPNGLRRRTPGLRREEVAQLAGVGITWYTWLEQGRDIRPSSDVLCSLARVLQLEPDERAHLFRLSGHEPPAGVMDEAVRPAHRRVLERWEPYPAVIGGKRWDVLAQNRGSKAIWGSYDELPESRRNMMWAFFTLPNRRQITIDWAKEAEKMVATFRAQVAPYLDEPGFQSLLADLRSTSPEFADLWERQDVHGSTVGLKRLQHPELGYLELEHTRYHIEDQPGLFLYLYAPAPGSRTESVMQSLDLDAIAGPGALL